MDIRNRQGRERIDDRQVNELIGVAQGLIADEKINQAEAEYLFKWLVANKDATGNPVVGLLFDRVGEYLSDNILGEHEAEELISTLKALSGGDYELGEVQKSASLPLCYPAPQVDFLNRTFCFSGKFVFGDRKACEFAVRALGASSGRLTNKTNYLVIGAYATESWAHSSFGRKIEKAVSMRGSHLDISIISEDHWLKSMPS